MRIFLGASRYSRYSTTSVAVRSAIGLKSQAPSPHFVKYPIYISLLFPVPATSLFSAAPIVYRASILKRGAMFETALSLSVVFSPKILTAIALSSLRSTTRQEIPYLTARSLASFISSAKLRLDWQGIIIPRVLSQAILLKIPTSALSLPPLLPKIMPEALLSFKIPLINAILFSVSDL